VATRRTVLAASAVIAVYSSALIGLPFFLAASVISGEIGQAGRVPASGYFWLAASGIVHFILGRYCNYRSIAAIGSNRSQPIQASNLVFTVAISLLFLGERPQAHTLVGTALIMLGPLVSIRRPKPAAVVVGATSTPAAANAGPPVRLVEGYVFGVLAAACYGSSPALVKLGLSEVSLPVWGATVSVGASFLVLLLSLLRPGQLGLVLGSLTLGNSLRDAQGRWWNSPVSWLVIGALTVVTAQLFRYLAIGVMDVTVSAPLIATVGVWSVFFAWIFNRQVESFSRSALLGVGLSVVGSVVLVAPLG